MPDTARETREQVNPLEAQEAEHAVRSNLGSDGLSDGMLETAPLEVRLRYEEDVSAAYRAWYVDQVKREQRSELGRFLFGVSFASIGLLATIAKLSPVAGSKAMESLGWAMGILLLSSGCSLYLAIPRNRLIDPNRVELVKLHKASTDELRIFSLAWLCLWIMGLLIGVVAVLY